MTRFYATKQFILLQFVALAIQLSGAGVLQGEERPNILWISCEDISPHLGCYGDPHAITPNLDSLAAEGLRYAHAFTTAGVCAPCRSAIITGMYQNCIGTHHMRCDARLPDWLEPFPLLLRRAGYYCTNHTKTDYQFSSPAPGEIWDESSGTAHWRNRPVPDQPFFAVFNFTGCHESGIAGDAKYRSVTAGLTEPERQDADALTTLPPYYPDTAIVREDWKRNYELITALDHWAGGLIQQLKEAGEYENTIVFFWSDHGIGLPRAKRWLYDSGTHIPLLVRIPKRFRDGAHDLAGQVKEELVSSIDFAPTVLNLAGVPIPEYHQGRAFLGRDLTPARRYVYGARDRMDERYDIIRSVRDQRYRYIRNFEPLKPYYQYMNTPEQGATMRELRRLAATGDLPPPAALFAADRKPPEELYDLQNDPHEIHNLAGDAKYQDKLAELRAALSRWQQEIGDLGLIPEAEIAIREARAGSRYAILHQAAGAAGLLDRLVRIAGRASAGEDARGELVAALSDDDAAIRYWGATGLGNLGQAAASTQPALTAALNDPSPSVRIAAARGLASIGETSAAIETLVAELQSEHPWGRLAAAIVLDEMDEDARTALPALRAALVAQPNKYIVRVANRAINELQGTDHPVP